MVFYFSVNLVLYLKLHSIEYDLRYMKSKFIYALFDFLENTGKFLDNLMTRESLHYKDLRLSGIDPAKVYKGLKNLEQRKLLKRRGECYYFTKNGLNWRRKSSEYFKIRNKDWDRKWRLIIFDIPKDLHKQRVYFRQKLLSLGFFQLQKSVYVFPYSCEEELGHICRKFKISHYVDLVLAESIGSREKEVKKFFRL